MRTLALYKLALLALVSLLPLSPSQAVADDAALKGKWKLVVLPFGEDEFAMFTLDVKDNKLAGELVEGAQQLGPATFKSVELKDDALSVVISTGGVDNAFTAKLPKEAADSVRGMYAFRGTPYPARIEKTDAEKLKPLGASTLNASLSAATKETDGHSRIAKLEELLKEHRGASNSRIYAAILGAAEDAKLSEQQIRDHLKTWFADAETYSAKWAADCRVTALKAMQGKKSLGKLCVELAQEADKALAKDATLDQQSAVVQMLAAAARAADLPDLAKEAEARLAKIDGQLDEEYHKTVPPFKPETYAGRAKPEQNRVVLMELFTGAQCPPCVAADVAFDALLKTYQPTELVTLQYHLHIPGPDPLTNADSEVRSKYYAVRGTPSTYFNGVVGAPGGGGMTGAEGKYDQYRKLIDGSLDSTRQAKIDLNVARSGNKIVVTGLAQATAKPADDKKDDTDQPKLRLRLALTEESIRYVGGNKLRFHHHVVRGLPGGPDGKELVAGQVQVDQTIDLDELRGVLGSYLENYAKTRPFPNPLPEIGFKRLAIVAFIQDDRDKSILHAVSLPVPGDK